MGREIRRVPLDFDWPLKEVWQGYLEPGELHGDLCTRCEGDGGSPQARHLQSQWYGKTFFRPEQTGSTPFTPDMLIVKNLVTERVRRSREMYARNYGWYTEERAIAQESARLCDLWNIRWSHHLAQEDVDALIEGNRLYDFTHTWSREGGWQPRDPSPVVTAKQVNEWSLHGLSHDSINCWIVVKAACARLGVDSKCPICDGHGNTETYPGQRQEAEEWRRTEPPEGPGWQLWETTTEGSPTSPVFASADELAVWMTQHDCGFAGSRYTLDVAMKFVHGSGWAPSMIGVGNTLLDGVDGVVALESREIDS